MCTGNFFYKYNPSLIQYFFLLINKKLLAVITDNGYLEKVTLFRCNTWRTTFRYLRKKNQQTFVGNKMHLFFMLQHCIHIRFGI